MARQRYPVIALNWVYHAFGDQESPYSRAVLESGGLPVAVPWFGEEEIIAAYLSLADGFVLVGGPDYPPEWYGRRADETVKPVSPERAASDRIFVRLAFASGKPILGICAGKQLANVHLGGGLVMDIRSPVAHRAEGGARHEVEVLPGTLAAEIFGAGRMTVNSSHHQAADPERLGKGLRVSARSVEDGIVEALEPVARGGVFRFFVQWHPEGYEEEHRRKIFGAFIAACR